jgi:hypothetical protein
MMATVDTLDFNVLASNFGQSGKNFTDGDFNYDQVVDTLDFNLLASNFGTGVQPAGFCDAGRCAARMLRIPSLSQSAW